MSSKSGSAPQAPDPSKVIGQQTTSNVNTAVANGFLNRVNQYGPQGSKTYTVDLWKNVGGTDVPIFGETTTLSPEQQKIYDSQTQLTQGTSDLANKYVGRIGEATAQPFNYDGLPDAPVYDDAYHQKIRDDIVARNQPSMDRDREALRTQLANQGIGVGTEAWQDSFYDYNRATNDFRLGADIQAGNSAAQRYGLEANTRDRAIQERTALRTQPISEVSALLGTGNGVSMPQFSAVPQVQVAPTDVMGAYGQQYAGQMAQWQQQQQGQNAALGGLFGLAGALGGGYLRGRGQG